MAIAFISDLHLTPSHPDSGKWFNEFMSGSQGIFSQIYILGDLFEIWVGDDSAAALGQEQVQKALRQASDSGMELFFMHGNRDFLVGDEFEAQTGCKILPDPSVIYLDDLRILLSHGDILCTDDIEHQTKRAEMITSKWKMAFLDKPLGERIHTAMEMRKKKRAK